MKNPIEILEERVDELKSEVEQAQSEASSAKARVVILQDAVELLTRHAQMPESERIAISTILAEL
jgi:cell division septum initiation protein DivIVA